MKGHHWFVIGLLLVLAWFLYKKGIIKAPKMPQAASQPMQQA